MDIGAMSMNMAQAKLSEMVGMSVMKMGMDSAKENSEMMVQMIDTSSVKSMENSVTPHLGNTIDIRL